MDFSPEEEAALNTAAAAAEKIISESQNFTAEQLTAQATLLTNAKGLAKVATALNKKRTTWPITQTHHNGGTQSVKEQTVATIYNANTAMDLGADEYKGTLKITIPNVANPLAVQRFIILKVPQNTTIIGVNKEPASTYFVGTAVASINVIAHNENYNTPVTSKFIEGNEYIAKVSPDADINSKNARQVKFEYSHKYAQIEILLSSEVRLATDPLNIEVADGDGGVLKVKFIVENTIDKNYGSLKSVSIYNLAETLMIGNLNPKQLPTEVIIDAKQYNKQRTYMKKKDLCFINYENYYVKFICEKFEFDKSFIYEGQATICIDITTRTIFEREKAKIDEITDKHNDANIAWKVEAKKMLSNISVYQKNLEEQVKFILDEIGKITKKVYEKSLVTAESFTFEEDGLYKFFNYSVAKIVTESFSVIGNGAVLIGTVKLIATRSNIVAFVVMGVIDVAIGKITDQGLPALKQAENQAKADKHNKELQAEFIRWQNRINTIYNTTKDKINEFLDALHHDIIDTSTIYPEKLKDIRTLITEFDENNAEIAKKFTQTLSDKLLSLVPFGLGRVAKYIIEDK